MIESRFAFRFRTSREHGWIAHLPAGGQSRARCSALLRAHGPMTQADIARAQRPLAGDGVEHRARAARGRLARRVGDGGRGGRSRSTPLGRASRSGSTSASRTCGWRSPTSPTPCWPRPSEPLDVDHAAARGHRAGRPDRARGCWTRSASRAGSRHRRRHGPAGTAARATPARSATRRSCPAGSARGREELMSERARRPGAGRERRQPGRARRDRLGRRARLRGGRLRQGGDRRRRRAGAAAGGSTTASPARPASSGT